MSVWNWWLTLSVLGGIVVGTASAVATSKNMRPLPYLTIMLVAIMAAFVIIATVGVHE